MAQVYETINFYFKMVQVLRSDIFFIAMWRAYCEEIHFLLQNFATLQSDILVLPFDACITK